MSKTILASVFRGKKHTQGICSDISFGNCSGFTTVDVVHPSAEDVEVDVVGVVDGDVVVDVVVVDVVVDKARVLHSPRQNSVWSDFEIMISFAAEFYFSVCPSP